MKGDWGSLGLDNGLVDSLADTPSALGIELALLFLLVEEIGVFIVRERVPAELVLQRGRQSGDRGSEGRRSRRCRGITSNCTPG